MLFVAFAFVFNGPSPAGRTVSVVFSKRATVAMATIVTVLAAGAAVVWGDLFLGSWPGKFAHWFPAVSIVVGIIAQPLVAWALVWSLYKK